MTSPETKWAALAGRRAARMRQSIDLLSAVVMAAATLCTAWSAYQSSLWNSQQSSHKALSTTAVVRVSKFTNLALQRTSVHVGLFVHWVAAERRGENGTADFLFERFPEPLKSASIAWRRTNPFENPASPPTPFAMPEYAMPEGLEAERWEEIARRESEAAEHANAVANRYLLFTIIYASVLFFAGISGKFRRPSVDLVVLMLGALTLVAGMAVMLSSPRM
jgi:hypothetical protein